MNTEHSDYSRVSAFLRMTICMFLDIQNIGSCVGTRYVNNGVESAIPFILSSVFSIEILPYYFISYVGWLSASKLYTKKTTYMVFSLLLNYIKSAHLMFLNLVLLTLTFGLTVKKGPCVPIPTSLSNKDICLSINLPLLNIN